MIFSRKLRLFTVLSFILWLSGCATANVSLTDLNSIADNEIVVFGKIKLNPPIGKDEIVWKNVINLTGEELHRLLYIKAGESYYDLSGHHGMDFADSLVTKDGDYFYYKWKKDSPMYIMGLSFVTTWSSNRRETMTFRIDNGLKVDHSGKNRAVYIGTITFVRDEFFNFKDLKIEQSDYQAAIKAFQQQFNQQWPTERAKLSPAKS